MDLATYVNKMFDNRPPLEEEVVRKELSSMRNSQPPLSPTFMINQYTVRNTIAQKFADCVRGWGFAHVVLTGKVGGGKTHFLNWIESHLANHEDFYLVKFPVQDTSTVKHSFVKKIVFKLFDQYYQDFSDAISHLVEDIKLSDVGNPDGMIHSIGVKFGVDRNLATVLYALYAEDKKVSAAMRVLGAAHGRTELRKLKIKELDNKDYIDVIELFLRYKQKEGFLLILLDEFEHAYTYLTPAAQRNFFISYKDFVDKITNITHPEIALITSVTEQYEGNLRDKVERVGDQELALWSRLENHRLQLNEFHPSNLEEFKELFQELARRYKIGFRHDVGIEYVLEMRKIFFEYIGGETSQAMSYREAISKMIRIMDDMRRDNRSLREYRREKDILLPEEEEEKKGSGSQSVSDGPPIEQQLKNKAEDQWDNAHHNKRPGLIKSTLEVLSKEFDYKKLNIEPEFSVAERGDVLYVQSPNGDRLFFIGIAANAKTLATKFKKCLEYKDKLSAARDDNYFDTYFIYPKQIETKTFYEFPEYYPDVNLAPYLDDEELYDLLAYKNANGKVVKENLLKNIERFVKQIF